MSSYYESEYDFEEERRQELNNRRVRRTTETYYERYCSIYQNLIEQGLAEYIPDKINRLRNDLDDIEDNLEDDPFAAREISFDVAGYIYGLRPLGRAAKIKFEASEIQRKKELEAEERNQRELEAKQRSEKQAVLAKEYFSEVRKIKSPAVQNFCSLQLKGIKTALDQGSISDVDDLKKQLLEVISEAKEKVAVWEAQTLKNSEHTILEERTDVVLGIIESQGIDNQEKKKEIIRSIEDLKKIGATVKNVSDKIQEVEKKVDETLISENLRREAVKSIFKQLKTQGFTVDLPKLKNDNGEDIVIIKATMPSGKRAMCKLTKHGKIQYAFDKYEGMTCLKDIQKFTIDLEKIYSVKLSNERIIWSNPDKIGKDSFNNPASITQNRG